MNRPASPASFASSATPTPSQSPRRRPAWIGTLAAMLVVAFALSTSVADSAGAEDPSGQAPPDIDPFAAGVRPTPHQSPEQERLDLVVPEGFEVQLVAAEPEISKPLNMAFDARGRLWVTDTVEYPYAAPPDRPGRDTVKILEDTNGDGRADKITTFADGLNIPIGVYPYGRGAVVFSIPYIWYLEDTDGDDHCDHRQILYGPFGYDRDVHGLNNAFRRTFDGWMYACHGFNNHSEVAGKDGNRVVLDSGNTYRVRLDGSRIEHFTHGQVNPFGMTIDPLGNLFTADCHSKPVYALLRGGYYPSFGKPDDGLGFVPPIMEHLHGSTAISGVVNYQAEHFPAPYRGNLLSGNVMTSRINRNRLTLAGSTYQAHEEPDFLISRDPWFRPVDLQIGLDGSLYVADFYNRIIGHYEVPLDHPGRDRTSGRIWRIVYRGNRPASEPPPAALPLEKLVDQLGHPNLSRRLLALNHLVDHRGKEAEPLLHGRLGDPERPAAERASCLWALYRLGRLEQEELRRAANDADRLLRVHALKIAAELDAWHPADARLAAARLEDPDPFVRRAAADALGQHPAAAQTGPLLEALRETPTDDPHLIYVLRRALCRNLQEEGALASLAEASLEPRDVRLLTGVLLAVPGADAAHCLTRWLQADRLPEGHWDRALAHVVRWGTTADLLVWIARLEQSSGYPPARQLTALTAAADAVTARGEAMPEAIEKWAERLAGSLLQTVQAHADEPRLAWRSGRGPALGGDARAWSAEPRGSSDGMNGPAFFTSLAAGETYTGSWRSEPFAAPEALSFFLAGHRGFPNNAPHDRNRVELHDAATGQVLATAYPPRNDVAQPVHWDLAGHQGQPVYVEIVDGDDGTAYAWLAAGRFSLEPLNPLPAGRELLQACELIKRFRLESLTKTLIEIAGHPQTGGPAAVAIGEAAQALKPDGRRALLALALRVCPWDGAVRSACLEAMLRPAEPDLTPWVVRAFQESGPTLRPLLVAALVTDQQGLELLLDLVEQGTVGPQVLATAAMTQRLAAADAAVRERAERLGGGGVTEDPQVGQQLAQITADVRSGPGVAERGRQLFQKHCAACHQVAGQGAVVGPQLDGITQRGVERVLEDIAAPNRNVDVAFRTTTLVLDDGRVLSGLVRQPEEDLLLVYDQQGQAQQVPMASVEQRIESPLSLMPSNFGEQLGSQQFADLIAFLSTAASQPSGGSSGPVGQ